MLYAIGLVLVVLVMLWLELLRRARFPWSAPLARQREVRAEGSVETVRFAAIDGVSLEGWLFLPAGRERPPLVVMAPGMGGTKEGHLEPFAWRFVQEDLAVLLFDYRCFGGSAGTPRHWVDPFRHREDYEAALRFARGPLAERVDADRIALWGSSFAGGTSLVTAASAGVAAVVAQAPFLATPPALEPRGLALAAYVVCAVLDSIRVLPSVYVPLYGRPGEWAFARSIENPSRRLADDPRASRFWRSLPPLRGGWENRMLARMLTRFDDFQPLAAVASVRCPLLLVAGTEDDLIPIELVRKAHASAPRSELVTFTCGHFDLYVGEPLAANLEAQAAFLSRELACR